jgi:hypothetical protein
VTILDPKAHLTQTLSATGWKKRRGALTTAFLLFGAGLPGVITLLLSLPSVPGVPRAAMLINPIVLLIAGALVGNWLAPRCGYQSIIAGYTGERGPDHRVWANATGLGAMLGAALATLDHLGRSLWQPIVAIVPSMIEAATPTAILTGILYGGVAEEIIMRWGLMTLLTWSLWRVLFRSATSPPLSTKVAALIGAAILFALAHIPAILSGGVSMQPMLFARIAILNSMAGVLFGTMFLRAHLEAAIASHMAFHVGVVLSSFIAMKNW